MVHTKSLITSTTMFVIITAFTLLNICHFCLSQEDISHNLIRDPIELGNQQVFNSRDTHYEGGVKRKHGNRHRRPPVPPSDTILNEQASLSSIDVSGVNEPVIGDHDRHNSHGSSNDTSSKLITASSTEESGEEDCPVCAAARKNAQVIARLDDETLRAVRVEIVKQQILKKLRLKEPPKMDNMPKGHNTVLPPIALGNPILSNTVRNEHDDDVANLDLEDFYGKTEQIIVLPQDELQDCSSWATRAHPEASSCFVYNLPKEVRSNQISSAELWVYKLADVMTEEIDDDANNTHNFSISEIVYHYNRGSRKPALQFSSITARENVPKTAGWISFNITDRARKWLVAEVHEHTIKISCSTCSKDIHDSPFDSVGEQQPFIVFNMANGKRRRRNRRSLNCTPGIKECCRESLYISFEEIKWDWVLEPKGFDAYYCKGQCHGDTALAHTATRHSGILIDYVKNRGGVNNNTVELVPCCTATEMSSISLIYRDPQSYNTTFQHVKLPNMVVKSCGCK